MGKSVMKRMTEPVDKRTASDQRAADKRESFFFFPGSCVTALFLQYCLLVTVTLMLEGEFGYSCLQ